MDDVDTFTGIFISGDLGIYDIGDPRIPSGVLNQWLDSLSIDELRTTIRLLIEKPVGFDAGIPGAG